MYFVISVINPNGLSILNNICQRLEIPVILSLIGHGTASQKIRDLWGIESTDKRILFAVADENKRSRSSRKNDAVFTSTHPATAL